MAHVYGRGVNEHSRAALQSELSRFPTVTRPDIDARAANALAGVVHEKPSEIRLADVELEIAREREEAWIRRDDARADMKATRMTWAHQGIASLHHAFYKGRQSPETCRG